MYHRGLWSPSPCSSRHSSTSRRAIAAVDARRQVDAANWTDHALDVMEPDAAIVSWWSYSTPLWYAQRVEGRRPDITIIDDRTRLDENLGGLTEASTPTSGSGRSTSSGSTRTRSGCWPTATTSSTSTVATRGR